MSGLQGEPSSELVSVRTIVTVDFSTILLLLRAARCTHNNTQWELPGGKADGPEDMATTFDRENEEETGSVPRLLTRPESTHRYTISGGKYARMNHVTYGAIALAATDSVQLRPNEHMAHRWMGYGAAMELPDITEASRQTLVALECAFIAIRQGRSDD